MPSTRRAERLLRETPEAWSAVPPTKAPAANAPKRRGPPSLCPTVEVMARTWLSIRVELVEGHGKECWPRPGRVFAAARGHTFKQLADAIDDAFARWDRSHLQQFTLTGQARLCHPDPDWEIEVGTIEDYQHVKLSRLRPGEQFVYVFDLGDDWAHLCTVDAVPVDPVEALGILPGHPLPYRGWGDIPDQYRRRWDGDDGESAQRGSPGLADLPPLRPHWGPVSRRQGPRLTAL
jgi:hypothetical protein